MNNRQKNIIFQYFKNRKMGFNNRTYKYYPYEIKYADKNPQLKEIGDVFKNKIDRANYFNQKFNTNYKYIHSFNFVNNTLAFAELNDDKKIFINKEGKPSVEGITKNDIDEMFQDARAAYYNTIQNKYDLIEVSDFKFGENNEYALGTLKNFKKVIISEKPFQNFKLSKKDVLSFVEDMDDNFFYVLEALTNYYKSIQNVYKIRYIDYICMYGCTSFFVKTIEGNEFFINYEGIPSIDDIDDETLFNFDATWTAVYFNQKLKKNMFKLIFMFDESKNKFFDDAFALAKTINDEYYYINEDGIPTIKGIKENYNLNDFFEGLREDIRRLKIKDNFSFIDPETIYIKQKS